MQDNICIGKKIRIINKSELKSKIRQGTDIGRKKKTDNTFIDKNDNTSNIE